MPALLVEIKAGVVGSRPAGAGRDDELHCLRRWGKKWCGQQLLQELQEGTAGAERGHSGS